MSGFRRYAEGPLRKYIPISMRKIGNRGPGNLIGTSRYQPQADWDWQEVFMSGIRAKSQRDDIGLTPGDLDTHLKAVSAIGLEGMYMLFNCGECGTCYPKTEESMYSIGLCWRCCPFPMHPRIEGYRPTPQPFQVALVEPAKIHAVKYDYLGKPQIIAKLGDGMERP